MKPPTFSGDHKERPIQFLNQLNDYLNIYRLEGKNSLCMISQCLVGNAKKWWQLNDGNFNNVDEFSRAFKNRFWNVDVQKMVRKKIDFNRFNESGKSTRTNYAMEIFSLAKDLDNPYSEEELVRAIGSHFERDIYGAIIGQGVKTSERLFEILDQFEDWALTSKKINNNNQNFKKKI